MKRSKHSLSNYKLLTAKMGELVPCNLTEVLPGDTFQGHTSLLIRMAPMLAPVMHPVIARIHHWFVPTRLLWDQWENFITGGPDGKNTAIPPMATSPAGGYAEGSLLDYLGVPTKVPGIEHSELPQRAYNMIWSEFYRDQDLQSPLVGTESELRACAWEKDYFTSSRPHPQKGDTVTLPLTGDAKITGQAPISGMGSTITSGWNPSPINVNQTDGTASYSPWKTQDMVMDGSSTDPRPSIWADGDSTLSTLEADMSGVSAVSIDALREAFALQRYKEARSRYGSRYVEYLRYLGVNPADSRLQRPEYLGGGKQTVSFSEVLRTGSGVPASSGPIGEMLGHGIAALKTRRYRKHFQEHGYVLTLMSVRPKTMYTNGLPRTYNRRTKEDYWQKELQHIGQQEVLNQELFMNPAGTQDDEVFGYQDRYAEYRYQPSTIAGDFRDTLKYWHMARMFTQLPALNADFVECDTGGRNFASQTTDHLWVMANNSIQARRMVASNANPKVM